METIKKTMSFQDRYYAVMNNLYEIGMTTNDISKMMKDMQQERVKRSKNPISEMSISEIFDYSGHMFDTFGKWVEKFHPLFDTCGMRQSLYSHADNLSEDMQAAENKKFVAAMQNQVKAIESFMKTQTVSSYSIKFVGDGPVVNVVGNVMLERSDCKDGLIPVKFGKVSGSFNCNDCGLTTLKNSPIEVGDYFCASGNKILSLEGCPKKVGIRFEMWGVDQKTIATKAEFDKACKVGRKIKEFDLPEPVEMINGDLYPTKVVVDKMKYTTIDNVGVVASIHVVTDYWNNDLDASMMRISFWTQWTTTPFDAKYFKTDRIDGIETEFSPEGHNYMKDFFIENINVLIDGLDVNDIDWWNYDIPASSRSYYEDGYGDLFNLIGDSYSHFDKYHSFLCDGWLGGVPQFEYKVFKAFHRSAE